MNGASAPHGPVVPDFRLPKPFLLLLCMSVPGFLYGQWEDVSTDFMVEASCSGSFLGCGISAADFNGDGRDDLTIADASGEIYLYARAEEGFLTDTVLNGVSQPTGVLWVDVDGDGDLDLFVGRRDEGVRLFIRADSGEMVDESVVRGIPNWPGWRPRGISAADFDNDHDLDIYVASYHIGTQEYHYPNAMLINQGGGFFVLATDSVGVGNGIKTTFHGGWLDHDRDGWQDLWVINDRLSFANAFYRNMGDGTFEDWAPNLGLDVALDPMSATVFDPDQDGDWDLFSTDVPNIPHRLFNQTDSGFVEVASSAGVSGESDYGWGACVVDVDGDAREDLMVSTMHWPFETNQVDNRLYIGSDTGIHFTEDSVGWPNEQFGLYHLARFDLDGDRAPDIAGHGTIPILQLLRNTNAAAASRLTVRLVGTTANSHAVGAIIEVFAEESRQMQQVDAGSDYVTQHSYTRFFGVGSAETVDSVVVTWPGGNVETWYGLDADAAHILIQGTSGLEPMELVRDCPWDAAGWVVPSFPGDATVLIDGSPATSDTLWMTVTDTAMLEVSWWDGSAVLSWPLSGVVEDEPDEAFQFEAPNCYGEAGWVSWSASQASSVQWQDSTWFPLDTAFATEATEFGVLWNYGDACVVDTLITYVLPDSLVAASSVSFIGDSDTAIVTLDVMGGTPPYNVIWDGPLNEDGWVLAPAALTWSVEDDLGCVLQGQVNIGANEVSSLFGCRDGLEVFRVADALHLAGNDDQGRYALFDLTGRLLDAGNWRTGDWIGLPMVVPVILRLEGDQCGLRVWLR